MMTEGKKRYLGYEISHYLLNFVMIENISHSLGEIYRKLVSYFQ